MKIMGSEGVTEESAANAAPAEPEKGAVTEKAPEDKERKGNPMDANNLTEDTLIPGDGKTTADITVTPAEKLAFVNALVSNSRLVLPYELFGGKIKVSVRSMTFEETRALSEWCIANAPKDIGGQISGKFRRYLLLAQVDEMNGVKFEPLAKPLFATVGKDGKMEDPGWIGAASYWDDKPTVVVSAIARCVADFNRKYEFMTLKAEDVNFWNPDTP